MAHQKWGYGDKNNIKFGYYFRHSKEDKDLQYTVTHVKDLEKQYGDDFYLFAGIAGKCYVIPYASIKGILATAAPKRRTRGDEYWRIIFDPVKDIATVDGAKPPIPIQLEALD